MSFKAHLGFALEVGSWSRQGRGSPPEQGSRVGCEGWGAQEPFPLRLELEAKVRPCDVLLSQLERLNLHLQL